MKYDKPLKPGKRETPTKVIIMTTSLNVALIQTVRRAGGEDVVAKWLGKSAGHVRACCNRDGDRSFTLRDLQLIFDNSGDLEIIRQLAALYGINIPGESDARLPTDTLLLKKLLGDKMTTRVKASDERRMLLDVEDHDSAIDQLVELVASITDWIKVLNEQRSRALQYR
ncbi:hypothetical protein [Chromobacterium sp. CV08]|uniref:hypothetical protein n=1 Tax=Chromobacterium sp. CV08 TaxID=3133274 RepID=UPI003DA7B437